MNSNVELANPSGAQTCTEQLRENCGPFCRHKWTQKLVILGCSSLFFVFMQILNSAGVDVYVLGILPRTAEGLAGLIGAPWVHVSWSHLVGNLIGWNILGFLLLLQGRHVFFLSYLWISVVGGFIVWIVARTVRHVGLSGVIFGFFGFLLFATFYQRPVKFKSVIGLIVALFAYGGTMLSGVFIPNLEVSWESHVVGFLAGCAWAFLFYRYLIYSERFCSFAGVDKTKREGAAPGELPVTSAPGGGSADSAMPPPPPQQQGNPTWSGPREGDAGQPPPPAAPPPASGAQGSFPLSTPAGGAWSSGGGRQEPHWPPPSGGVVSARGVNPYLGK
mmetsp:Transcript_22855/g.54727  ORF Transcript_22855/g.54727 Transcript_22855/m.54727 type:complete len:332 (-) Transcript_22855:296-1291(-)